MLYIKLFEMQQTQNLRTYFPDVCPFPFYLSVEPGSVNDY